MILKYKKLSEDAVAPIKGTEFSAGWDFTAISKHKTSEYIQYGTGLALEIPVGKVGLLFPRSSITKKDLMLKNSIGVIDCDYRGEIMFRFYVTPNPNTKTNFWYEVGERIGQIIFFDIPEIEMVEVDILEDSVRGTGGYGSTGK